MNPRVLIAWAALSACVGLSAQTSPTVIGLYNTGTLVNGTNPYVLRSFPTGNVGAVGLYEPDAAVWPINGVWIDNTASTQWLAVSLNSTPPNTPNVPTVAAGDYTIRLNFDLGAYDPVMTGFAIHAAADNRLAVSLNGFVLPNQGTASGDVNYSSLASYAYTVAAGGALLHTGQNWIDFVVTNAAGAAGNPAGLYVEFSEFTGAIPEPSTCALLVGIGALGAVLLRRRRR